MTRCHIAMTDFISLGLSTPRPLFLRTTGNRVTHKIALRSGSMCLLHGRTELRYQRSLPKGFGTDEEQFFLFFIQRAPPKTSASNNQQKIPLEPTIDSKTSLHSPATQINAENCLETAPKARNPSSSPKESVRSSLLGGLEDEEAPQNQSTESVVLKTPPSPPLIKRRLSNIPHTTGIQFQDDMEYEVGDGLLLTETISAAVENMSDEVVTGNC